MPSPNPLLHRDPSGAVALVLLTTSFAITAGGLPAATAVMSRQSYEADKAPRGR